MKKNALCSDFHDMLRPKTSAEVFVGRIVSRWKSGQNFLVNSDPVISGHGHESINIFFVSTPGWDWTMVY